MTFEYDIFTFYVSYEDRNLRIMMTEFQPESGDAIIVDKPIDMTYVVNDSVYNQAKDLIAEYDEEHN
tara:strand:- start:960 stop:1160 length:201 start_codon:yes stop_codon:yes gene_type:complete